MSKITIWIYLICLLILSPQSSMAGGSTTALTHQGSADFETKQLTTRLSESSVEHRYVRIHKKTKETFLDRLSVEQADGSRNLKVYYPDGKTVKREDNLSAPTKTRTLSYFDATGKELAKRTYKPGLVEVCKFLEQGTYQQTWQVKEELKPGSVQNIGTGKLTQLSCFSADGKLQQTFALDDDGDTILLIACFGGFKQQSNLHVGDKLSAHFSSEILYDRELSPLRTVDKLLLTAIICLFLGFAVYLLYPCFARK